MITEQNKWAVIEAYLAGKLDETGRQEVAQKMTNDADFRADVLMQATLNEQFDEEQTAIDLALVDRILSEHVVPAPKQDNRWRPRPIGQQPWVRALAGIILLLGVGWLGYTYLTKPTVISTRIVYEQRSFGMTGTTATQLTTYPVDFSDDGPVGGTYSSEAGKLHVHLSTIPADISRWRLRDEAATGGFQLSTPQGRTYLLDRDTYGQQKPFN